MDKLKTILVDDEPGSVQALEYDLRVFQNELDLLKTFTDPHEALNFVKSTPIDLLFLDLHMPGLTGFEFLEFLGTFSFQVIFVTAHEEHALKAFEFDAIDYILKPPRKKKLALAVQKALTLNETNRTTESTISMRNDRGDRLLEKIAIPTSYGWDFVYVNDVYYLQADGNYTKIFLSNGQSHLISKTLKNFEELLDFEMFFRSHQSFIVNLNHVENYYKSEGGYLKLKEGENIPVARSRKEELHRRMNL